MTDLLKKIAGWKTDVLFIAGRTILVQTVAASLKLSPIVWRSFFLLLVKRKLAWDWGNPVLAFLAKLGWKLINNDNFLGAKFRGQIICISFLPQTLFARRSIVKTRVLLKEESKWIIGNGEDVSLWQGKTGGVPHPTQKKMSRLVIFLVIKDPALFLGLAALRFVFGAICLSQNKWAQSLP